MGKVLTLPVGDLDAAWERYAGLARRVKADPTNRALVDEMLDAFKVYSALYGRESGR